MFAQPFLGAVPKNTFLLNPKNKDFLNGGERKFKDFTRSTIIVIALMILLCGGIGGGMAYTGVSEITVRSELEQSGVDARATVIDTDYTTSSSKSGTTYTYYMTYEFYVREGNADTPTRYTNRQEIT